MKHMNVNKLLGYFFCTISIFYFLFFCLITNYSPSRFCTGEVDSSSSVQQQQIGSLNYDFHLARDEFDFEHDTLALLHIQKTSGTAWESHVLEHLWIRRKAEWEPACVHLKRHKRKICVYNEHRKSIFWDRYISRFCDIHADYTELKNCVMHEYKNRISSPILGNAAFEGIVHFMTFLRDPVRRYISEFEHVKRGATWGKAVRTCKEQKLYSQKCFHGDSWANVDWNAFLRCEYNMANNRQVRMLANYNILGCNVLKCWVRDANCSANQVEFYEQKLLQSAKHTLLGLSFFGLTEHQSLSEYLFLKTFDESRFKFDMSIADSNQTNADSALRGDAGKLLDRIKLNNHLDLKLYEFAKDIFFKKVHYFKYLDKKSENL